MRRTQSELSRCAIWTVSSTFCQVDQLEQFMTQVSTANGHSATYNLKAVVQETNLKPDTLRAWERRYGLPNPERTAGGHRLYSQRDIDTLKWLIA